MTIDREARLADLRKALQPTETLTVPHACAKADVTFLVRFDRKPGQALYTFAAIVQPEPAPTAFGLFRKAGKGAGLTEVDADLMDWSLPPCPGCGFRGTWTVCGCGHLVCGARHAGGIFTCRDSCGRRFRTVRATSVSGAAGTAPGAGLARLAGPHVKLLPGRRP